MKIKQMTKQEIANLKEFVRAMDEKARKAFLAGLNVKSRKVFLASYFD